MANLVVHICGLMPQHTLTGRSLNKEEPSGSIQNPAIDDAE